MTPLLRRTVPVVLTLVVAACGSDANESSGSATTSPTAPSSVATTLAGSTAAGCATDVAGVPVTAPGVGGRFMLTITTGAGCAWSAQTDANWALVDPVAGVGSGRSFLTLGENGELADTRSANVTVNGQVIHFWQASACAYTLDRTTAEFDGQATTMPITITTREGCPWQVSVTESWAHLRPTSGSGPKAITIDVDANTGGERHATATIAGIRVPITQRGR